MSRFASLKSDCKRFWKEDDGVITVQFVIIFPVFFGIFLMTFESGMINAQHVMLERGIDFAVRDVRIGTIQTPTRAALRERICEVSAIIPDCMNQLEIELLQRDPVAWAEIDYPVRCIDRGEVNQPVVTVDTGGNNELMILRACVRIDPYLVTSGLGKAIVEDNSGTAAGGSYALVSLGAFVVEPFRATN